MKTKSVHFFVKEIPEDFVEGTIGYVNEVINTGGAMNLSTGVFSAPVPGIYHFDFSAMKGNTARSLDFYLRKNGRTVASKRMDSLPNKQVASISASLKLKVNDTVYVYALGARLYDDWRGITNFAGWLVEEDLKFMA